MARRPKSYVVKSGKTRVKMNKETLKATNLSLVLEYKTADDVRKGRILSEYFDLNRSFVTYFPRFHGDYREEIINTFVCMLPDYFMRFDPTKATDINSYLAMYAKKNAVRDFLYLLPTVQHNRFYKDETGRTVVEKAQVQSMDSFGVPGGPSVDSEEMNPIDYILGQTVFKDFLNSNRDPAEEFLDGVHSYSLHFSGEAAKVVKDFEDGLRWREVQEKNGISADRFLTLMLSIRMQLQRLLKGGGKNVRFITRTERSARDAIGPKRGRAGRTGRPVYGNRGAKGRAWEEVQGNDGDITPDFGRIDDEENQSTFFMEGDGPEGWSEGEAA